MVHDSNRLLAALDAFIRQDVTVVRGAYEVSAVKRDGTVFIRFKSVDGVPAAYVCDLFQALCTRMGWAAARPAFSQFRLALDQVRGAL